MLMESLVLAVDDREAKQVVTGIASSPEFVVTGVRFEQGVIVVDTTVRAPVPIHPSFRVEVVAARGTSLTVRISGPMGLGAGPLDVLINRIAPLAPRRELPGPRRDHHRPGSGEQRSAEVAGHGGNKHSAWTSRGADINADVDLSAFAQAAGAGAKVGATGGGASVEGSEPYSVGTTLMRYHDAANDANSGQSPTHTGRRTR